MANKNGTSMVGGKSAIPSNSGIPNKVVSGSKVSNKSTPRGSKGSMTLSNGSKTGIMRNPS